MKHLFFSCIIALFWPGTTTQTTNQTENPFHLDPISPLLDNLFGWGRVVTIIHPEVNVYNYNKHCWILSFQPFFYTIFQPNSHIHPHTSHPIPFAPAKAWNASIRVVMSERSAHKTVHRRYVKASLEPSLGTTMEQCRRVDAAVTLPRISEAGPNNPCPKTSEIKSDFPGIEIWVRWSAKLEVKVFLDQVSMSQQP